MTTHQKGFIAEAVVAIAAVNAGWIVSKPQIEARYDLVLDDGKSLYRVQIKYANHFNSDALEIDLRRECRSNGDKKVYTLSEIDAVVVYCPVWPSLLWLPSRIFHGRKGVTVRQSPAKNGQKRRILMAEEFQWLRSSISRAVPS